MDNKEMRGGWLGIDWSCSRGESNEKGRDGLCCVNMRVEKRDVIRGIQNCVCWNGSMVPAVLLSP